jgi:heterodisulfide reductase subunit A
VAGTFQGPKDIPETVTQASGAAALAGAMLADSRGELAAKPEHVPPNDVRKEPPRIGVFVCHCGTNIAGYVDVQAVEEFARTLPHVVHVERSLFTCSQDTQEKMKEIIISEKLNRVVVASCTPRTHEPLFQETIESAGLNRYLFEMANIRDQCSWVHMDSPEDAKEKAFELVRMAVAKAARLAPLERLSFPVTKRALVVGGGAAGMTAALTLAGQGFESVIVEKENELGGHLRHIRRLLSGEDPQELLGRLIEQVSSNKLITIKTNSRVKEVKGFVGNYRTTLDAAGADETIEHGVIILAPGAAEHTPPSYGYGTSERIITQTALEEKLATGMEIADNETFVMIQCVGSRDDEHPYCSRYCCSEAVKNVLWIFEKNPRARVFVLYRDLRTYGMRELSYLEARKKGALFLRFKKDAPPVVTAGGGKVRVEMDDLILHERIGIDADWVVLAAGAVPHEETGEVARLVKVPLTADGFLLEAHMKLRPVDGAAGGVFMAGLAHAPKCLDETIAQAQAAVGRAACVLAHDEVIADGKVSIVNVARCAACGACEAVCPYSAVKVVEEETRGGTVRYAKVTEAMCKGCGSCAAACRSGAIDLLGFRDGELAAMLGAFKYDEA